MTRVESKTLPERLEAQIEEAVAILRRGGVVAYPTDTLYGLGVDAFNEVAVERLFAIKSRPQGMPLPLLLSDIEGLSQVTEEMSPLGLRLAEYFWPGPLTLVVPAGPRVPNLVTARGWTVAVRVPHHPIPREMAKRLGTPLTGTSANRSGGPDPRTAEDVQHQLGSSVELIIREDPAPQGQASTVLDITSTPPRLLRVGAVPLALIQEICGAVLGPTSC